MEKIMIAGYITPDNNYKDVIDAFKTSGCEPFISLNPADALYADRIVLPGSSQDINPSLWGEENTCSNDINDELDKIQWEIMDIAVDKKKPVLGICRGMQFINVYFGGTVIQDLNCKEFHTKTEKEKYHTIKTAKSGFMYDLFGSEVVVNSRHHQGIGIVKDCIKVAAVWTDEKYEVIEAICHKELPITGVQWHPESMCLEDEISKRTAGEKILKYFLEI